jgi:hypothetical protein
VSGKLSAMRATVQLLLPDGTVAYLSPGDVIGRMWTAELRLDDPGISEAHALISLRGHALKLLALRGRFLVNDQPETEVDLAEGQRLRLSRETTLTVASVTLPDAVLAIEGDGMPQQILAGTCALWIRPAPRLARGYDPRADALLWTSGESWRLRLANEPAQTLHPNTEWTIGEHTFRVVALPLSQAGQPHTIRQQGVDAPLTIIAQYDTVQIHRAGSAPTLLSGQGAQIISELVAVGGPLSWEALARHLWRGEIERSQLRRKWDVCLLRLRRRLTDAGIRADLIQVGSGHVELVTMSGDTVEDRT